MPRVASGLASSSLTSPDGSRELPVLSPLSTSHLLQQRAPSGIGATCAACPRLLRRASVGITTATTPKAPPKARSPAPNPERTGIAQCARRAGITGGAATPPSGAAPPSGATPRVATVRRGMSAADRAGKLSPACESATAPPMRLRLCSRCHLGSSAGSGGSRNSKSAPKSGKLGSVSCPARRPSQLGPPPATEESDDAPVPPPPVPPHPGRF